MASPSEDILSLKIGLPAYFNCNELLFFRFYMVLDLKAKSGSLTYDIVSVNMTRSSKE